MKREISAGGVVIRDKEMLLIKDSYGRWSLPKGLIEKNETTEEAALREVREETGLKNIELVKKIGEIKYFYQLKGEKIFKIVIFFLMKTEDKELKAQWEIQDAKWFSIDEALEKIDYKNTKIIIEKALELIKQNF